MVADACNHDGHQGCHNAINLFCSRWHREKAGSFTHKFYVQPYSTLKLSAEIILKWLLFSPWVGFWLLPPSERVIHWDQTPCPKINHQEWYETTTLEVPLGAQVPLVIPRMRLSCLPQRSPDVMWGSVVAVCDSQHPCPGKQRIGDSIYLSIYIYVC